MEGLPVYDNHFHMSPSGRNVDALREFEREGGTGITLVTLPYREVPIRVGADFARSYEITYDLAAKARESTSVEVNVAVGPYPVLIVPLAEAFGLDKAKGMLIEGMEAAEKAVAEGKAAAIGEIGRPHFGCDRDIWDASNEVLARGMEIARENGCPVIIHSESSPDTDRSLAEIAGKVGLDPGLVVKHSSPPYVTPEETCGVMPSLPASKTGIRKALSKGSSRFMIETDYIDDPARPSSVMACNTVPNKVRWMLNSGIADSETVCRICGDIPQSLYSRRQIHTRATKPAHPGRESVGEAVVEQHVRFRRGPRRKSACRTSPRTGRIHLLGCGAEFQALGGRGGGHGDTPFRGRPLPRDVCSSAGRNISSQRGIFTNFKILQGALEMSEQYVPQTEQPIFSGPVRSKSLPIARSRGMP